MKQLAIIFFMTSLFACSFETKDSSERLMIKRWAQPKLTFNKIKDSLYIQIPKHNYLQIDLLLGTDSSLIAGGQPSKFTLSDIKSSTGIKVDTTMQINGKIDGVFKCKDSSGSYHYWPFYDLYK